MRQECDWGGNSEYPFSFTGAQRAHGGPTAGARQPVRSDRLKDDAGSQARGYRDGKLAVEVPGGDAPDRRVVRTFGLAMPTGQRRSGGQRSGALAIASGRAAVMAWASCSVMLARQDCAASHSEGHRFRFQPNC